MLFRRAKQTFKTCGAGRNPFFIGKHLFTGNELSPHSARAAGESSHDLQVFGSMLPN
jgi:hypothetical protein